MMKKKTLRRANKGLNAFVAILLLLQPVGTPGILGAYLALGQTAADTQTASGDSGQPATASADQPKDSGSGDAPAPAKDESGSKTDPTGSGSATDPTNTASNEPTTASSGTNTGIGDTNPADSNAASDTSQSDTTSATPSDTTSGDTSSAVPATDTNSGASDNGTISPDAASTEKDTTETKGKICLEQGANIISSDKNDWTVSGDIAETKGKVELGVKYVFPGNENVSVTFTCLPALSADRTTLKIQQIASSDINLPEGVSAATDFAYDITTGMKDGDFKYDLTLPKSDIAGAEVNYIEKSADEVRSQDLAASDLKTIEDSKIEEKDDSVKVEELDHFTVYIVVANQTVTSSSVGTPDNGWVSDNVYATFNSNSDVAEYGFPDPAIVPPAGAVIDGIEVLIEGKTSSSGGRDLDVSLWNASSSSYSSVKPSNFTTTESTHTLGTPTDKWGKSWQTSDFADATFKVKVDADNKSGTASLDQIQVQVNYTLLPDLTATKTHTPSGNASVSQPFIWTIRVQNSGTADATFTSGNTILTDNLPSSGATYGSISVAKSDGTVTGTINCSISSNNLNCAASGGNVVIPAVKYFDVTIPTTPTAVGSLANPRVTNGCKADPTSTNGVVSESNESNNTCSDTVTVSSYQVTQNPSLPQACGLDIAIVMDVSGSIDNTELNQMRSAFKNFVTALEGTPTQFSLTKFDTTASVLQSFTSDSALIKTKIDSASGGQWTNWEDGLKKAQSTFDPRSNPNLVIFASDGNPNTIGDGPGNNAWPDGSPAAMNPAIAIANALKSGGTRILAIGIGTDLVVANMEAISGPNTNTGDVLTSDVITTNFSGLAAQLATFATQTCGGTITVNKYIDSVDPNNRGGAGWQYNIAGTSKTTDSNGQTPAVDVNSGSGYSVTETNMLPGYSFGSASCKKSTGESVGSPVTNGIGNITIGNSDIISCDFVNTTNKGSITIIKDAQPDDPQDFSFTTTGSGLSSFSLDDDADGTLPNTKTFSDLMPGSYSVTEDATSGWDLDDITCNAGGTPDKPNKKANITITPGANVTCTFTNEKQQGTLNVIKHVINDNGGTKNAGNFTINVTGSNPSPASFSGSESGTAVTLNAGSYSVDENSVAGYAKTLSSGCSGTIAGGDNKTCTITNDDQPGTLIVKKMVINDNGGAKQAQDFSFSVDSGTAQAFEADGQNDLTVNAGTYNITEPAVTGYTTTYDKCSNMIVPNGGSATCTITNNDIAPTLKLVKTVTNDNGGNKQVSDFTLKIDGTVVTSGVAKTVLAGNHAASEDQLPGYSASSWGGDCAADGTTTLLPGDNKTCTITNNDIAPKLTLVKHVTNDNGGNAVVSDFPLFIDGNSATSGTAYEVQANTLHTATETNQSGYTPSSWSKDCAPDGTITLLPGDDKTCEITNDDVSASITLIKKVENDNGGNAGENNFGLTVGGTSVNSGQKLSVDANKAYAINETGLFGYKFVSLTGDAKCPSVLGGSASLNEGEDITCTITNDDIQPKLTVYKIVSNDNGGNLHPYDFSIDVSGNNANPKNFSGSDTGTQVAIDAGAYGVTETEKDGYEAKYSADCSGSIAVGETKTCTITNDDEAPTLTLVKTVTNDNGGDKKVSDFNLYISGNPTASGVPVTLKANTPYAASEDQLTGYSASVWGTDCAPDGSIILKPGENKTCTITNDDIAPKLTLVKHVTNNDGGNAVVSDFPLFIDGKVAVSGTAYEVEANVLKTATETNLPGYTPSTWSKDCAPDGTITLLPGEEKTCEITNDDVQPKLTVTKVVVNDGYGALQVTDFPLYVDTTQVASGVQNGFNVGNYVVSENNQPGYKAEITGDCDKDGNVVLNPGDVKICTITNDDELGKIIVEKQTVPDKDSASFSFKGDVFGSVSDNGQLSAIVVPGKYSSSEMPLEGWALADIKCDDTDSSGDLGNGTATFNVQPSETVICTFTNNKPGAQIDVDPLSASNEIGDDHVITATVQVHNGDGNYMDAPDGTLVTFSLTSNTANASFTGSNTCATAAGKCSVAINATQTGSVDIHAEADPVELGVTIHVETGSEGESSEDANKVYVNARISITPKTATNEVDSKHEFTVKVEQDDGGGSGMQPASGAIANAIATPNPDGGIDVSDCNDGTDTNGECKVYINSSAAGIFTVMARAAIKIKDVEFKLQTNGIGENSQPAEKTYADASINLTPGEATNSVNDPHDITATVMEDSGTGPVPAAGELATFTLPTNTAGATFVGGVDTCTTDTLGQCKVTINSNSPGNVSIHATADVGVGGLTLTRASDSTHGSSGDASKKYEAGKIIVEKQTLPDSSVQIFGFTASYDADGFGLADGQTNDSGFLAPGAYSVAESPIAGWELTGATCFSNFESKQQVPENITLEAGEIVTCTFNNTFTPPALQIQKSNNKYPIDQAPGSDVTYTLTVTALLNDVNGVEVIDLPPAGFTYRPGSWTASSSIRGDIKNSPTTEPTYHSPGVWNLGDMKKDEVVTLTYTADISVDQASGSYPDLAWTQGKSLLNEDVLGKGISSHFVQDAFVGTEVAVVKAGIVKAASVEIETNTETEHKDKKTVRKTVILPATGASPWLIVIAILILLAGVGFFWAGKRKKKEDNPDDTNDMNTMTKLLIAGLVGASLLFGAKATQAATTLAAKMETPKSPYQTTDFNLGFVALDINGDPVTVQCFLGASATPFQAVNLAGGGTSGNCNVNSSVIPGDGTYQFHITASDGSETVTTPDVPVEVITGGPGTPTNYNRDKVSACQNVISFTTADDGGKTVRAEIYRSTERSYTADASTLVTSIDTGSNQAVSYTDTRTSNCNTVYYAVRAFDALGNGSGVVADERTVVRITGGGTTTVTTTVTAPGAIPVATGGAVAGEAAGGEVAGEQAPSAEEQPAVPSEEGQVLGEEKAAEAPQSFIQKHKTLSAIIALAILALIYYAATRKRKPKFPEPPKSSADKTSGKK